MSLKPSWVNLPPGSRLRVTLRTDSNAFGAAGAHTFVRPGGDQFQRPLRFADFPVGATIGRGEHHNVAFDLLHMGEPVHVWASAAVFDADGTRITDPMEDEGDLSAGSPVYELNVWASGQP